MNFLPEFFKEEIKCGFVISSMRKRSWAAQLEVLQIVSDICKKNHLQYFANGGTLLGAVRHHGFIPWDDDIDICLKREEYRSLIDILPKELPKGFYVRGIHSETPTGVEQTDSIYQVYIVAERARWDRKEYMKYFHGYPFEYVGIDVWPIDSVPFDKETFEVQRCLLRSAYELYWGWGDLQKEGKLEETLLNFEKVSGITISKKNPRIYLVKVMDSLISLFSSDEGEEVQELNCSTRNIKASGKHCYDEVIYMPFENIELPIPAGYDEILTNLYGDWQKCVNDGRDHGYPEMEQKLKDELKNAGFSGGLDEFCEKVLADVLTFV